MTFCMVCNDTLDEFFYAPTHSNFGLPDPWYPVTIGNGDIQWPNVGPNAWATMMTEVPMTKYVPATGWILFRELSLFLKDVWPQDKQFQRLGQSFLNHFKDRFPDPWPELFYCEDVHKTQFMIHGVCR